MMLMLMLVLMLMLIPMLMIMTMSTVWQKVVPTPESFAWEKEKRDDVPTQASRQKEKPRPGDDHELSKSANPNNKFAKSCVGIQGHMQVASCRYLFWSTLVGSWQVPVYLYLYAGPKCKIITLSRYQ